MNQFSPQGNLFQVEYAMEAVNKGTAAIGIKTPEGIVIAIERKASTKLFDDTVTESEKIYRISKDIGCTLAGRSADALVMLKKARDLAQRHLFVFDEEISVEEEVQHLCDHKQHYTQFGGLRPFGVSFLIFGWDKFHGFSLYKTDPSGNFASWKASAIGKSSSSAFGILKEEWSEQKTLRSATKLALSVLFRSLELPSISSKESNFKFRFHYSLVQLARLYRKNDSTVYEVLSDKETDLIIKVDGPTQTPAEAP